jgi:ABC-type uncharacterized transport system substrate-binding protein
MSRRRVVVWIAVAGLSGHATMLRAQPAEARAHRVGLLMFGGAPSGASPDPNAGFYRSLRELGHAEGRNVVLEARYAKGRPDRLAARAADLVQLKVDVILAGGPAALAVGHRATSTIPIVEISGDMERAFAEIARSKPQAPFVVPSRLPSALGLSIPAAIVLRADRVIE